ncbi:MAG TPA: polysaccharide biosynthesis/export family protein [Candidatus Tumulicola sp.]|nr:polysaccharide biosynthesis/export family protein [Candidatus Tumulicola sp.]
MIRALAAAGFAAACIFVQGLALAAGSNGVATGPAVSVPGIPAQTVIHPGDQIGVLVYGDQTLTQNVMVLPDGTIEYPLVGRVMVAGKTPSQAAEALSVRLKPYVRHPVITISIVQLGQPDVLVLGEVKQPGKYQLRSDAKLTDAIAAAGGIADTNGAFPDARIADANGKVTVVSLQSLLQRGDTSLDVHLSEGSVVYVPGPIPFTVDVSGAVDHPGDVQLHEGDRLSMAIAKAGNSQNSQADLNHIRLIRTAPDGTQTTTEINLYNAIKGGDVAADVPLQKGDVVFVPQAAKHSDLFSGLGGGLLYLLTTLIP